tara:strand:+ start:3163 stop:4071 length:909 start_codon:yes stop_codon:yes gene_type:complete
VEVNTQPKEITMKTTPERVTPEQFKNWIFDPPAGPRLVSITPDIAYEALIYNDENHQRPLSQGTISEYARRMATGWPLVPAPIVFDTEGRTQDGQHRLNAVVESNKTLDAWCFFGEPVENFPYYDIGKKRSPSDIFAINGIKNYTQAAAVVRKVYRYYGGTKQDHPTNGLRKPSIRTPQETYEYYLALGAEEVQASLSHYFRVKNAKVACPSSCAAMAFVANKIDPDMTNEFFYGLATGANLGPRSVIKKLRDELLRGSGVHTSHHVSELVARAWNARRLNRRNFSTAPSEEEGRGNLTKMR